MRLVEHEPASRAVVSDHFFATVLEQLSDGVVMVGADGKVLAANVAATQMFGSNLLRGAPFDSVLPAGGERLAELIGRADDDLTSELTLAGGEESRIVEVRLTKVRNELHEAAGVKDIRVDIDAGHETFVIGDANRLQQVVWNLLSNAVKFTERGGAVNVTVRREDADVSLTVTDNGRGIEPEFLPGRPALMVRR